MDLNNEKLCHSEHSSTDLNEYERQIFDDVVHSDGLVITAKGIFYNKVVGSLLHSYSDAGNLVLVINCSEWEEQYYKSQLDGKNIHDVANSVTERERVYLEGGIQFISTRILVVDLLKNRIPVELITGIIVLSAHTIHESCQESFALRLYRRHNRTGFIKAFSNSPESFAIGYCNVERILRNLFLKNLFIWPRFHAMIQTTLKPFEPRIEEFHIPMSEKMIQIQCHILDVMNYLVKELKRINRSVDMGEVTVENCVTKKFYKLLQAQLDCIWHQLNSQTKLIIADLKIMRNLMLSTIYNDSVSAYALIKRYRTTEYALHNSGWTLTNSAENIFKISRDRVYNISGEFKPEHSPKWKALLEILKVEIQADIANLNESIKSPKIIILCQDSKTAFQLNQVLTQSAEKFLLFMAMKNDISVGKVHKFECVEQLKRTSKSNQSEVNDAPVKDETENNMSEILAGEESDEIFSESYVLTLTQNHLNSSNADLSSSIFESFPEMENLDITSVATSNIKQPFIYIHTFKTEKEGPMALERIFNEVQPNYIIMYHYNVTVIRQIEVYEARRKNKLLDRVKVFFLLHDKTVEEQSYLTSLRREKQAFELLIDTKSKMLIPEYQDGKSEEAFVLLNKRNELEENTRNAGGQLQSVETPTIIVDMREFRSDLPCLIHKRGLEVVPVTITIGDYILTPDICVERKSISDLIGSLNSGRLYNQCVQMQRNYLKPILLIEFDQNKPFHLQGKYMLSNITQSNTSIITKLELLTLHFPKLRLIWSPSPYATAQFFEEFKSGKPEPDGKVAATVGTDDVEIDKYNSVICDFLIRLPGINSKNINGILRNVKNLKELIKLTQEETATLLHSQENSKLLWSTLHDSHKSKKEDPPITAMGNFKPKKWKERRN